MNGMRLSAVLVLAVVASGCYVRAHGRVPTATVRVRTNAPPPPPQGNATVTVNANAPAPTLATGVTVVEASCQQGAQEVCNGLDDNCDGQIDEGCGYQSGNIQITLAWQGGADLDMYVTDPQGQTLSYGNTNVPSGGRLDQDARGACNPNQPNNTIENVYWDQPNPPQGTYNVEVHYWDGSACSTGQGPTNMTLSVAVGGQIRGAWQYTISPGQRIPVVQFPI